MPYIVTTKRRWSYDSLDGRIDAEKESRRAVATLEEKEIAPVLRPLIRSRISGLQWVDLIRALGSLPEQGGTVGPLPDGTVIEVEPVLSWSGLADTDSCWDSIVRDAEHGDRRAQREILDAYNARQS